MLTPQLRERVQLLTNPPPIDEAILPSRWLKGTLDDDGSTRGFYFPIEGTPGWDFITDASEESFVEGPFAVGKSQILAFKVHHYCLTNPGARCGFLRKTKESVKGSIVPTYYRVLGYDPTQTVVGYVHGYGGANPQRFIYRNGSVIHILGLNKPDDFLSTEFHCMGVPQAEELNLDEWELVSRRTRLGGKSMIFGDVNPSFEQHFLNNSPHIKRFKMTHKENPEYWNHLKDAWTEKGEREIEKLQRMTGVRYKRGYLGIWCAQEGVVYSMYDTDLHDVELMKRDDFGTDTVWNMSIDYGFQNAWAANFWAMTPNGVHHHYKEIYRTKINLDDLIQRIQQIRTKERITQINNVFADHDAEHNDRMELEGFPIVRADKHVLPGIEIVKSHFENGTIKFNKFSLTNYSEHNRTEPQDENLFGHPKCLRDELGVYAYRPEEKRTFTEKDEYPVEYGDHAMDSMRYYLATMHNRANFFPISRTMSIGVGARV